MAGAEAKKMAITSTLPASSAVALGPSIDREEAAR
jgi:hypothetical protein